VKWLEIAVLTPAEGVEAVAEIYRELGTGGVIIEDPAVIFEYAARTEPEEWGVPPCMIGAGMAVVKAYVPAENGAERFVGRLETALGGLVLRRRPEISACTVAGEDWANAWKTYYKPMRVGKRLVIKPAWESYAAGKGDLVIEMDPGMAFGCGTHATTSLCLELLERHVRPGQTVYDIGTGSGILAVAAARLGASRVVAVDIDPAACRAAAENTARNAVADRVRVICGDMLKNVEGKADLIVSNIIANAIIEIAPDAAGRLLPGGIFIASGIIRERAAEVCAALETAGLTVGEHLQEGQWTAVTAKKF